MSSIRIFFTVWFNSIFTFNYLQRSYPGDHIRHILHAFIVIFESRHTGCCYDHVPHLAIARSALHGISFGWFVFLSSHLIPAHSISGLYPPSGGGRQISPSLNIRALPRDCQALVLRIQTSDSAIQRINHYPADKY